MKNKVWLFTAALLLFTAGCGEPDMAQNKINSNEQKTAGISDTDETESEIDSSASEKMEAAEEKYIWKEITLQFPESWEDKYVILEDDTGFSVFQKKSYEKESGTGFLFGITKDTEWYPDAAGVSILGYTDDGVLYEVVRPTDVSCDVENEDTLNEYQGMMQQSDTVVQKAVIDTQNLHKDADQYIIPVSMTQTISADSLINMSDNDLWLARNEIYARHGRGFTNEYLQSYFNACSWYERTAETDAFDESVLSQTEKDNLKVIQEAEKTYADEHPYPKEYKTTLSRAMPYSKAQLVSVKYIVTLLLLAMAAVLAVVVQLVRAGTGAGNAGSMGGILGMLLSAGLVTPAVLLPLVFRFGVEKARILYGIVLGLVIGCMIFVSMTVQDMPQLVADGAFAVRALPVSAVLFGLSWLLSIRIGRPHMR